MYWFDERKINKIAMKKKIGDWHRLSEVVESAIQRVVNLGTSNKVSDNIYFRSVTKADQQLIKSALSKSMKDDFEKLTAIERARLYVEFTSSVKETSIQQNKSFKKLHENAIGFYKEQVRIACLNLGMTENTHGGWKGFAYFNLNQITHDVSAIRYVDSYDFGDIRDGQLLAFRLESQGKTPSEYKDAHSFKCVTKLQQDLQAKATFLHAAIIVPHENTIAHMQTIGYSKEEALTIFPQP